MASTRGAEWQAFLASHGLPERWHKQRRLVFLDTDFASGQRFLKLWEQLLDHAPPDACLVYLSRCPPATSRQQLAQGLARWLTGRAPVGLQTQQTNDASERPTPNPMAGLAQALLAAWPLATPDLHLIDLQQGRVRLLLAMRPLDRWLSGLLAQVDAVHLAPDDVDVDDAEHRSAEIAQTPALAPAPWWQGRGLKRLTRLAGAGTTLSSSHADPALARALSDAGFALQPSVASALQGRFAPRHQAKRPAGRDAQPAARRVAVIGAGLAGAAAARALAAQGLQVAVYERHSGPAMETSGQAAGLFHGAFHANDGHHARWLRQAALHAQRVLGPLIAEAVVPGQLAGLLRGEYKLNGPAMQAQWAASGLPADYVRPAPGAWHDGRDAWWYAGGGWVAPAALVRHWLAQTGITLHLSTHVQRLQAVDDAEGRCGWALWAQGDQPLASADAVVLANADDALRLLQPLAHVQPGDWPLQRRRGQTTLLPAETAADADAALPQPLAASGYALQLPDGKTLCGATSHEDDNEAPLRASDHRQNLATLQRLTGRPWLPDGEPDLIDAWLSTLGGRVGWRLSTDDRLPLVGPVPLAQAGAIASAQRLNQPRHVPRVPGLWLLTALGSRGITQAALAGELLAAWLSGAPLPLDASLVDALDPARFAARALRRPGPPP